MIVLNNIKNITTLQKHLLEELAEKVEDFHVIEEIVRSLDEDLETAKDRVTELEEEVEDLNKSNDELSEEVRKLEGALDAA